MSILTDDTNATTPMTEDAAVASLMDRWSPKADNAADVPAEGAEDPTTEEVEGEGYEADGEPEVEETEEVAEGEETPEGEKTPEAAEAAKAGEGSKEIADDAVAKVTVDGQEIEFTGAQLKRLAGQEASLTRKSQEADRVGHMAANTVRAALAMAKEELDEYEGVDWAEEARLMDPDFYALHFNRAQAAAEKFERLMAAAQGIQKDQAAKAEEVSKEAKDAFMGQVALAVTGWTPEVHQSILSYGESQGISKEALENMTDTTAYGLLRKAQLYDQGKATAAEKIAKAPQKKTVQPAGATGAQVKTQALQNAETRLKSGKGNDDDAVAILMGRWSTKR